MSHSPLGRQKLLRALVILTIAIGFFFLLQSGLAEELELQRLQARLSGLQAEYSRQPVLISALFFAAYVICTAFSIPGALLLTLLSGAIFGVVIGSVLVSFASTIGATLSFLVARFLLRDWITKKWGQRLRSLDQEIQKNGELHLLTLRLIPAIPFFLVNLLMGLTPIRTKKFFLFSQIGMFPATVVYVFAGQEFAKLNSLSGLLSTGALLALSGLALLPILTPRVLSAIKSHRTLARFQKPKSFDYNLIVIGAGSAGLVTSYIAAASRAKVALIEKHKMGGDCLNTGCVPSKALIRSSRFLQQIKESKSLGFESAQADVNFAQIMERIQQVISKIEPHDSVERYQGLGVDCLMGHAKIRSPFEVDVNGKVLTTRAIVVATGARPRVPKFDGLDQVRHFTSDSIWSLREQPKRLLVVGGGPIGCELAQAFSQLGSKVELVEAGAQLLGKEDLDVANLILKRFQHNGITVHLASRVLRFEKRAEQQFVIVQGNGVPGDGQNQEKRIEFDVVLLALGREANVKGFGLEELGVQISSNGTIAVDEHLRTNIPNIFACGDVAGPFQFTHAAAHQAWFAAINSLFGRLRLSKVDYRHLPWVTFTTPEVARLGINETMAKSQNIDFELTRYDLSDLDRAIADSTDEGFLKVLTEPGTDRILGVTIVGEHAGELLSEFTLAMKHGLGLRKILSTIHPYPTMGEANKYVAGLWQRSHSPKWAFQFLDRWHSFNR